MGIVGIVAGVIGGIVLVGLVAFFVLKLKKKKKKGKGEIRNTPTEANFQNVGQRSGDGDDGTITLRPMPRNIGSSEPAEPEVNSTEGSEGVVNPAASYDESIQ